MDLNRVMIIGRLTRDPEGRTTPQGTSVTSFSVATNFIWVDQSGQRQEKVEYHNVVAWRKLADICNQYLKKGGKVYIEGRLQTRDWEGQDGVKRYRTEIIADNMIMLDRPSAGAVGAASTFTQEKEIPSIETETPATAIPQPTGATGDDDIRVENIPF